MTEIRVVTIDSGLGGLMFAKDIISCSHAYINQIKNLGIVLKIIHICDDSNIPFGTKTSVEIERIGNDLLQKASDSNPDIVFVACNTISTIEQKLTIPSSIKNKIHFLIKDSSKYLYELSKKISSNGQLRMGIFATKFTINNGIYQKEMEVMHKQQDSIEQCTLMPLKSSILNTFDQYIDQEQKMNLQELHMQDEIKSQELEHSNQCRFYGHAELVMDKMHLLVEELSSIVAIVEDENTTKEKKKFLVRKAILQLVSNHRSTLCSIDIVGLFCTHFPIFLEDFREVFQNQGLSVIFISQGEAMSYHLKHMMRSVILNRISDVIENNIANDEQDNIFTNYDITDYNLSTVSNAEDQDFAKKNDFLKVECYITSDHKEKFINFIREIFFDIKEKNINVIKYNIL